MSNALSRAAQTPGLITKLLLTLGVVVVYRFGSFVPAPFVNFQNVQYCLGQVQGQSSAGLYDLVNLFSGGALLQLSVFAMGIMPYITASIIVQLLRVVIPRFDTLYKEGESGQAKLTQYTRYLTIGLGILQSTTLVTVARAGSLFGSTCNAPLVANTSWWAIVLMILTLTAGTGAIMWLGEIITEKGIGNGMSLLIFCSIAASFPSTLGAMLQRNVGTFVLVLVIGIVLMLAIVFIEQSQRRIPVQYAKRMVGKRIYGGGTTYIPLKVNMAGVVPVIFASSLLYVPALIAQFNQGDGTKQPPAWVRFISEYLTRSDHPAYMIIYFLLILGFTYFYVAITFNPEEQADNLKKYGGFIPGVRAGRPTARYLGYVLNRITLPGALYLSIIALIPLVALSAVNASQNFPFGGTSILILVGVGLDMIKRINAQLQQRHYEGLLK
jgi:preprotein translocase subunit SecY